MGQVPLRLCTAKHSGKHSLGLENILLHTSKSQLKNVFTNLLSFFKFIYTLYSKDIDLIYIKSKTGILNQKKIEQHQVSQI